MIEQQPVTGSGTVRAYLRYDYAGVQLRLIEVVTEQDGNNWQSWMMGNSLLIDRELLLDLRAAMARAVEMERRLIGHLDATGQSRPLMA